MGRLFFIIVILGAYPGLSHAGVVCDGMKKDSPDLYKLYCAQDGSGNTKPAGSSSSFSDAFKLNTAALPTENSAYGLEIIPTFLRDGQTGMPNFALIKGFHRFGTGISTSGGNTFYSNDVYQRLFGKSELTTLSDPEPAKGYFTNLNLGTSFLIFDPSWGPKLQLGISGRYNRITNTVGGGPALLLAGQVFGVGIGISHEQVTNFLPAANFTSVLVSARFWSMEVEYTVLSGGPSGLPLSPVQILTGTYTFKNFIFTAAIRKLNYYLEGDLTQPHFAVQYFLSSHLALGYLYNYIPGGNSLGLQIYL